MYATTTQREMKVLIADDHGIVRSGLAALHRTDRLDQVGPQFQRALIKDVSGG